MVAWLGEGKECRCASFKTRYECPPYSRSYSPFLEASVAGSPQTQLFVIFQGKYVLRFACGLCSADRSVTNTCFAFQLVFYFLRFCGRGITIDENSPRPPWESRLAPQPEPEEGKRPKTNKEIFVDVELD